MIGRVYRGGDLAGLTRYLFGPGRHHDHDHPHLVAAWDASDGADLGVLAGEDLLALAGLDADGLAALAPGRLATACRGLSAEVSAPLSYAERPPGEPVWHCALRAAPGDRVLSDAEWAEVAVDLMDRTGIARRGDEGACRWVAVRHAEDHIHVAAVLARSDGGGVRLWRDFLQLRQTCLASESRLGLTPTAPADATAAVHTTRAEVERAARQGQREPARDWLRERVQLAAIASREPGEFLERLRAGGVTVRERRGEAGELTGYAVAREESSGPLVFFGGGKLAADLSLPKLAQRWAGAGELGQDELDLTAADVLWERVGSAAEHASTLLAGRDGGTQAGDAAVAAAEVLTAAGWMVEGEAGGPLTDAARRFDRAQREAHRQVPAPTAAGRGLRAAAWAMARAGRRTPAQRQAAQVALMVSQIAGLSLQVAALREAQGRAVQAQAARAATASLVDGGEAWGERARWHLAAARSVTGAPHVSTRVARSTTTTDAPARGRR